MGRPRTMVTGNLCRDPRTDESCRSSPVPKFTRAVRGYLRPFSKIRTDSSVCGSLHILPLTIVLGRPINENDPYVLNMWPSYVKNYSALRRPLVSFILIEKFKSPSPKIDTFCVCSKLEKCVNLWRANF